MKGFYRSIVASLLLAFVLLVGTVMPASAVINGVSATVNGGSSTTVAYSDTVQISFTVNRTSSGNDNWRATRYRYDSGPWICVNHSDFTSNPGAGGSTDTATFTISAPFAVGTYDLELEPREDNDCGGSGGNSVVLADAVIVNSGIAANPNLNAACGLDIVLVLDASRSIETEGAVGSVRTAVAGMLDSLEGTGSQVAIVEFATSADVPIGYTSVTPANITNVFDPYLATDGSVDQYFDGRVGNYTNWEAGLAQVNGLAAPDLVVFFTDGNPNTVISDPQATGNASTEEAVLAAAAQADLIKTNGGNGGSGSHIFVVGVGDVTASNFAPVTDGANALQYVTTSPGSGQTDVFAEADYYVGSFDDLAQALQDVVTALCGGTITVQKLMDADGNLATDGDQTPAAGWTFAVAVDSPGSATPTSGATAGQDGTVNFDIDLGGATSATVDVIETGQSGYGLVGASCTGATSNGTVNIAGTRIDDIVLGNNDVVTCKFINTTVKVDPLMSVVKTASPASMSEPGGVVTFSVDVTNDSPVAGPDNDPLTLLTLTDDLYGDITDAANPNLVDTTCAKNTVVAPGDTYTCQFRVDMTGSQPGQVTDIVTVTAQDDEQTGVSANDDATVTITDVPSVLNVSKSVDKSSLPEPGGAFVYTATISTPAGNVDGIEIESVTDSVYGALDPADCGLGNFPITLLPGNTLECVFTMNHTGAPGDSWTNQITVVGYDDDGADRTKLSNEVTVNLTNVPSSLVLEKSVAPTSMDEPGGDATYTIFVTNTSTVDSVTITSLVDDRFTIDPSECTYGQTLPTLAPGAGFSCTFTRPVSGTPASPFVNTASVAGTDDDGQGLAADDSATVTFNNVASSLAVLKTADPTEVPEPGGDVTYTVRITNTSATDSVTVNSVLDDKFGDIGGSCTPAVGQSLAPGAAMSCVFTRAITGNAGTTHTNTVTVAGQDDDGDEVGGEDSETVTVTNVPSSLDVTKSASVSEVLEPGGDVEFTVVVENTSAVDNVTINSVIDDQFGDVGGSCTPAVGSTLAPGETMTCVFTRTITGNAGYVHTNVVTASGVDDDQAPVSAQDSENVAVDNVASSIKVTKTASVSAVNEPGADVTFTVLIENTSAVDNVTIDNLADDVYGDVDGNCTPAIGSQLAPGASMTCVFTGAVSGNAGASHVNTVTATGFDDDESPLSDSDSETVQILDVPSSIAVTKNANPTSMAEPGGDVTYTVVVRNTSAVDNVTITQVTDDRFGDVSNTCAPALPHALAPNGTLSCSFTRAVTGNAGATHVNVITATGTDDDAQPVSDSDTAGVAITNLPSSILVTKTANPTQVPETGGDVTFTVVVRNTSAVDSVTVQTVTDDKLGDLSGQCAPALPVALAPNQTLTCSVTKFLAGDFDTSHVNVATATGVDDDGVTVRDDDDATVRFGDVASSIRVTKSANVDTVTLQGQNVEFTVLVENTSPVDAVTITAIVDDIYGDILAPDNAAIVSTTCAAGTTLPVGGSYTCAFVANVSGTALGELHRNTVTVSGEDDDGGSTSDQDDAVIEVGQPVISAEKSSRGPQGRSKVAPGETLEYTIVIRNTGNRAAQNTVFDDTIDPETTLVAGTTTTTKGTVVTEDVAAGHVVVNIGEIAAGASVTIRFDVVASSAPTKLQILNQGVVSYTDPNDPAGQVRVLTDDPATVEIGDETGNIIEGPTAIDGGEEPTAPGRRHEVFLPFTMR